MSGFQTARVFALLAVFGVVGACARVSEPPAPAPPAPEPAPAAEAAVEPEASVPASIPEGAPPPVARELAVGDGAVSERRRALVRGEYALQPRALGYFMDVLEARLLQSLDETIDIRRQSDAFRLRVTGTASFDTGSSGIREFLRAQLRELARVLVEFENTLIIVHAHTDARGPEDFNQALSERRALRVAETLVDFGVAPNRLVAVGHGEDEPLATNETEAGRASNRRLEIVVEPLVSETTG